MATSNSIVGFTALRRRGNPFGQYLVSRVASGALMTLLPVKYSCVSRSQWVALIPTSIEATPPLEVRPSPGRGFGLFAVDHIPAYSRVLEDHSLLSMSQGDDLPQLWDKYEALPIEDRQTFDALSPPAYQTDKETSMIVKLRARGYSASQARRMARVSSRFQGNAFYAGMNGGDWSYGHLLFPNVARINHSCTPNAHAHYRAVTGAEYIYALRDIQAGEEIEISYLQLTAPRVERKQRMNSWSFVCRCPACSRTLGTDYDGDLEIVHTLSNVDGNSCQQQSGRIDLLRQAISIAESKDYPWLIVSLPHLYANLAAAVSEAGEGKVAAFSVAQKAAMWQDRIHGPDSPQAYFLMRDVGFSDKCGD